MRDRYFCCTHGFSFQLSAKSFRLLASHSEGSWCALLSNQALIFCVRSARTTVVTRSMAKSTSESVVERPKPKRIDAPARSPTAPMACSTWDGAWLPELQAE